jgi:hypothetical protein
MPLLSTRGANSAKGFGLTAGAKKISVQYLILAGGGGGGTHAGGGGGAGGYRLNVPGETSGANSSAEPSLELAAGLPYTITIGAGGTSVSGPYPIPGKPTDGSNSVLNTITSLGGGYGQGPYAAPAPSKTPASDEGQPGGSGGGRGDALYGKGTAGQGKNGGGTPQVGDPYGGGGGGGASADGQEGKPTAPGAGGDGLSSSITGSSIVRGGGGGGGTRPPAPGGAGGNGGGGAGGSGAGGAGGNGTDNLGGGGGAAGYIPGPSSSAGGNGGSGVVIVKIPLANNATFSPGITQTPTSTPTSKIYQVTAGTGTVTFS